MDTNFAYLTGQRVRIVGEPLGVVLRANTGRVHFIGPGAEHYIVAVEEPALVIDRGDRDWGQQIVTVVVLREQVRPIP